MMGLVQMLRSTVNVEVKTTDVDAGTSHSETFTIADGMPTWQNRGEYRGGMGIPGAWRAAVLLTDLLGGTPWHAYREDPAADADAVGVRIRPTPALLQQPSPPDIRMTTFSSLGLDLIWHGNGIGVRIGLDAEGNTDALVPVPAENVWVRRVQPGDGINLPVGNIAYWIVDPVTMLGAWYDSSRVLHIKGPCKPGALRGMSVLENHMHLLSLSAEQARQAATVTGSGIPLGTLRSDNPDLTPEEAGTLKSSWMQAQRDRSIAVLNATTHFEALAWNPTEAQLLDARKFSLHEIALIFGVDPSWLGVASNSETYSNVEREAINLVKFSLGGHLARFEGALSAIMAPGVEARADLDGLLRSDTLTRYQAAQIAINSRFLAPSEVRAQEGRRPFTPAQEAELRPAAPPAAGPAAPPPEGAPPVQGGSNAR